ncbi:MAG TPA: 16S rRNA (cytosine(1402)-N(4))-methyltransferase RsmH [Chitinophagaceae bacterium]
MTAENTNPSLNSSNSNYHVPVMLEEAIKYLNIKPDGIYVDCTFGGGGHSRVILERLTTGSLIVFDQDEEARQNLPDDKRIRFVPQNFRHLQRFLRLNGINKVDGILADLGVSSHQFDQPERGFSTRFDALLDMRMDQRQERTAVEVINNFSEHQLHKLFETYGEVTNSKTLAKAIAEKRRAKQIKTIEDFKTAISGIVKGNPNKYFAQVFQALRIEVNDELGALKEMLEQVPEVLNQGGRVVIITFHSIEDRIVKLFIKHGGFEAEEENPFMINTKSNLLKAITKKPIEASAYEKKINPRSRSAKMRVAEKI